MSEDYRVLKTEQTSFMWNIRFKKKMLLIKKQNTSVCSFHYSFNEDSLKKDV